MGINESAGVNFRLALAMPKALHSKRYQVFRELLIKQRKTAGLTQAQTAIKLEKPQSYVSKYENGERRLDVVEFVEVAEAIGFDPSKLIKKL